LPLQSNWTLAMLGWLRKLDQVLLARRWLGARQ
jgi:hypothetical protein